MRRWLALAAGLAAAAAAFGAVALATDEGDQPGAVASPAESPAAAQDGRRVFAAMGCGGCHTFEPAGTQGEIGPELDDLSASYTPDELAHFIANPTKGSVMPRDFERRMSAQELDALVGYLLQK